MDIAEAKIRKTAIYDDKIAKRKNLFELFQANNTMNSVSQTQIVCGNKTLDGSDGWFKGIGVSVYCKKEKNGNEEILVDDFDVISAFDFLHDRGLQVDHKKFETNYVMYPLGMYVFIFNYLIIE